MNTAPAAADRRYLRRTLALAARARGRTAPNPMVGAVVVSPDGTRVLGEGYHHRPGEPHAEVLALAAAGPAAQGGTLYVSLEPCCHHGRTPPCTAAILSAGIRRVVFATGDPFPRVRGGGVAQLRAAGLDVAAAPPDVARAARELNRAYLRAVQDGRAWLTLKMAMTLDGRIATRGGESRWITGEAARRHVHRLRDRHDAVLVGIGTARADDPQLTARLPGTRNPVRVVVDARAELSPESRLAQTARAAPVLLATLATASPERTGRLGNLGVELLPLPPAPHHPGRVDLLALLRALAERGLHSVLCEGGAVLAGALVDGGLVDEVAWFIAPRLLGDGEAPGPLAGRGVPALDRALPLHSVCARRLGQDFLIQGYLQPLPGEPEPSGGGEA